MIARIARATAIACVGLAAVYAALRGDLLPAFAVLGGGLLIAISFWAIRATVDDLMLRSGSKTSRKSTGFALVKFFTRHAIVALAAYGMMVRLHLDAVGLLLGVTSLGVAVGVEALRDLRWRRFL